MTGAGWDNEMAVFVQSVDLGQEMDRWIDLTLFQIDMFGVQPGT